MRQRAQSSEHGEKRGIADELVDDFRERECFPTFEEARDIEWIRVEGKFNMITEPHAVQVRLFDAGAYSGVNWLERCRNNGVLPMRIWGKFLEHMVDEYGDQDVWLDPVVKHTYERNALLSAQRRLNEQIDELEQEREKIEAAGPGAPTHATFNDLTPVE